MSFSVEVDRADWEKYHQELAARSGVELELKSRTALGTASEQTRQLVADAAPRRTGRTAKSVRVTEVSEPGAVAAFRVEPTTPYAHDVIGGTVAHSLTPLGGGSQFAAFHDGQVRRLDALQHPGAKANPFVERVQPQAEALAAEKLAQEFG